MSYKPKFCCQCGVPIERAVWTLLTSRRFCELCETDYKLEDLIPKITVALGILIGILGLGTFLRKAEKPLNLATVSTTNVNKIIATAPVSTNANVGTLATIQETNTAVGQLPSKPLAAAAKPDLKTQKAVSQTSAAAETIYFCGAETQKGTICMHRVRGGGRCWQHTGKTAMLPPEKLIASR